MSGGSSKRVRTPLRLPHPLCEQVRECVKAEEVSADNANDSFVAAIVACVKLIRRKQIDAKFVRMAKDADCRQEAQAIAESFDPSDCETLELAEREITEA